MEINNYIDQMLHNYTFSLADRYVNLYNKSGSTFYCDCQIKRAFDTDCLYEMNIPNHFP
jgi:hypothetical protein